MGCGSDEKLTGIQRVVTDSGKFGDSDLLKAMKVVANEDGVLVMTVGGKLYRFGSMYGGSSSSNKAVLIKNMENVANILFSTNTGTCERAI